MLAGKPLLDKMAELVDAVQQDGLDALPRCDHRTSNRVKKAHACSSPALVTREAIVNCFGGWRKLVPLTDRKDGHLNIDL